MVDSKKSQDEQSDDQAQHTTGLYPTKSNKIVKPINIKSEDQPEADTISKTPVKKPLKQKQDLVKPDKLKSTLDSDEQTSEVPDNGLSEQDTTDDNTAQVPDVEAETKHEFIDEGQYRITIPKKNILKKSTSLSKLMWLVFVVFLMVIAVYLYTDIFGVDLSGIINWFNDLIGM